MDALLHSLHLPRIRLMAIYLAIFAVFFSLPVGASEPSIRRHVVLVLCDCLTLDDLHDIRSAPFLAGLTERSAIGLMNCAVNGPKTPAAATLTLAIGQHLPSEPTDEMAFNDWELVPGEQGAARAVYVRRVGTLDPSVDALHFDPERAVKHLGIVSLIARGLDKDRLGAALTHADPPVQAYVCGNADNGVKQPQRRAALLTADATGISGGMLDLYRFSTQTPFGLCDDPRAVIDFVARGKADFVVVQMSDFSRAEAARSNLSAAAYHLARLGGLQRLNLLMELLDREYPSDSQGADVLLVSPRPPGEDKGHPGTWGRLTPILAYGPDFPPGVLTSPTTRTMGLIANIDIAPTLLTLFHAPIPLAMVGRPIQAVTAVPDGVERVRAVMSLDRIATLNGKAAVRVMVPLSTVCFGLVFASIYLHHRRSGRASSWLGPVLIFVQNMASGLLLAPLMAPTSLLIYGIEIVVWMALLTGVAYGVSRALRIAPPVAAAAICVVLVVVDTLAGQSLIKESVFSAYALSGIRYYGVGNEYLGIVVGFALMAVFAWLDDRQVAPAMPERLRLWWLAPLAWGGLAFLLGWPTLGANAGSLIVTGAGFGLATAIIYGRRPSMWLAIACGVAGLVLAFGFGALEATYAEATSSHIGQAIHASASGRGVGYLMEIALRKVQMNFRLLMSPWLLLGAAAVLATVTMARRFLGASWSLLLSRRRWTALGHYAVAAALVAGLLFKDSGVVMATYMAGAICLMDLYYLLTAPATTN